MKRLGNISLALALGLGFACAKKDAATDDGSQNTAPAAPAAPAASGELAKAPVETERVIIAPAEPPKIDLLDAGAEPRQELRFDPEVGAKREMSMTMRMKLGMQMGAKKTPPVQTPPIRTLGTIEVLEKSEGKIVGRMDFGKMEVLDEDGADARMAQAMRAQLDAFSGMSSYTTVDPTGAVLEGYLEIPTGIPDNIRQTMKQMGENAGQMTVPMPSEAVGVGGRWSATTTISNMGMNLIQTATYTLDKIEGSTAYLTVAIEQKVAPGAFTPPGLPPGTKVDIEKMSSTGEGKMQVDAKAPMPDRVTMDMETHMSMNIDAGGQSQAMAMDMQVSIEIDSTGSGPPK